MSAFVVLLDGDLTPSPRLREQVRGRRTIAADGGIRHADKLGLKPELWVGDFDSAPGKGAGIWSEVPHIAFPEDKDQTDGELAVAAARERGANDLLLAGAFGGSRADHALLHSMHAIRLAGEGLTVMLSDGRQEASPVMPGSHRFDLRPGTLFSLVGFTELAGLTISGAKWPLADVKVPFGSSLTLSNEVADGELKIKLKHGKALLLAIPA